MSPNRWLLETLAARGITEAMISERRKRFVRATYSPQVMFDAMHYGPSTLAAIVDLMIEAEQKETQCAA